MNSFEKRKFGNDIHRMTDEILGHYLTEFVESYSYFRAKKRKRRDFYSPVTQISFSGTSLFYAQEIAKKLADWMAFV